MFCKFFDLMSRTWDIEVERDNDNDNVDDDYDHLYRLWKYLNIHEFFFEI